LTKIKLHSPLVFSTGAIYICICKSLVVAQVYPFPIDAINSKFVKSIKSALLQMIICERVVVYLLLAGSEKKKKE
jgi:hypothetical protein